MNILVLMSGGFHPFHPGHLALYNSAKKAFPGADVVVGATNAQEKRPFNFKDKATLATIAGVDKGHFVEVNRQFSVKGEPNIENRIQNPDDTILIFVRSVKDANDPVLQPWKLNPDGSVPMTKGSKNHPPRPTSNYLLSYKGNEKQLQPMTKHAYIAFLPVQEFGPADMTSATEIRNTWPTLNDKRKQAFAMSLYPATQQNSKLLATVVNILNKNLGSPNMEQPDNSAIKQLKAKKLKEQIQRMRPLLKEASIEQKYKMLKLIKEATQLDELNLFKKKADTLAQKPVATDDYHAYFNKQEPAKIKALGKVYNHPDEYYAATKKDPLSAIQPVKEFAPPGGDDNGPDEDEILFRLAKQWWLGTEQDMIRVERTLASMGWEIGEDEGSYDDGGVFVVRAGDVNGKSYMSWPHEELIVDEGQTSDMRNFFSTQQPLNPAPILPSTTGPTVATVTRQGESINELKDETIHSYLSKADRQISNRLDRMSQARERLNKNYEIYDVNNPTKIIDKFEADTPKLARQYFEKFIKEYNPGDQDFHFEVRRSTGLSENIIIHAGTKVNLILVYKQKPFKLNKEPIEYTDENLKKYAVVAYMYLRETTGKKFSLESIQKAIVVKPLTVNQTNTESIDYLEEK